MGRIADARVIPYALALKRPWRTAAGEISRRCGCLVEVETGNGTRGFGDYAPLPLSDQKEGDDYGLAALADSLIGVTLRDALNRLGAAPAHAAMECALLDAQARLLGRPLRCLLDPAAAQAVEVNAVAEPEDVAVAAGAGFRVVKLKVGRGDPRDEAARLRALDVPPGVRLRLDANRAWSWDAACAFVDAIAGLPIDSLEEPLADADAAKLEALQSRAGFDLALDESLAKLDVDAILARRCVRRLVLKPSGLGGLRACCALAKQARDAGLTCVVTTALESAVGVTAAVHLAAAAGSPGVAHGLATADWLAEDVAAAPRVVDGQMALGDAPGLGIEPVSHCGQC